MAEIQNGVESAQKETRLRVWLAQVYPDSTVDNWQQILADNCIKCAISPLHDKDVFDDNADEEDGYHHEAGDPKKPHYHIVFNFSGKKSFAQVNDILDLITKPDCKHRKPKIPYGSIEECVQYLVHKNHKNKAKYLKADIVALNGFDVERCFRLNTEQEGILFDQLRNYISENNIFNYWQLFEFLEASRHRDSVYEDMFTFARQHTILIRGLLMDRMQYKKIQRDHEIIIGRDPQSVTELKQAKRLKEEMEKKKK